MFCPQEGGGVCGVRGWVGLVIIVGLNITARHVAIMLQILRVVLFQNIPKLIDSLK